ncbi:MAG TPA: hypothetical protein VGM90_19305 [Kofleriaceae bacterium]|jgi:hypothetical protein
MQRAEAIEQLCAKGYHAKARDWSLGESILVPLGEPHVADGITTYARVLYLYPLDAGAWGLLDGAIAHHPVETYADLAAAIIGVDAYAQRCVK